MTDKELDRLITIECERRSAIQTPPDFSRALSFSPRRVSRLNTIMRWTTVAAVIGVIVGVILMNKPSTEVTPAGNLYDEMIGNLESRHEHNGQAVCRMRENINESIPFPS